MPNSNNPEVTVEESDDVIEYRADIDDRRDFMKVLGSVAGVGVLAGCSGGEDQAGGTETTAGNDTRTDGETTTTSGSDSDSGKTEKLVIALAFEPWNMDPALHTDAASNYVQNVVYDEVIGLHYEKNEPVPELATELAQPVDDAGKVYDITLQEGIPFHNGKEATAEDLKYSFDWMADPDNNAATLGYAPQLENAETEIRDDYTVRLTLSEPHGLWNYWMTRVVNGLVPKDSRGEATEAKGPKGIGTDLTTDPVGTGPFRLAEWEAGNYIRCEAFEDHFREDIPKIDEIEFQFISEPTTRISRLRSDNVSFTVDVPPKNFESTKNASGVTAKAIPGSGSQVIYHNHVDTEDNPMSNLYNRRAVHYGVDAQEILDRVYRGRGVVQKGPWFPDSDWVPDSLKNTKMYDPEKAQAQLEKGPSPNGFEVSLMASNNTVSSKSATIIQEQLSKIGIDVKINLLDTGSLFSRLYGTVKWNMSLAGWGQSIPHVFWWLFAGFAPQRNHNNWHHAPAEDPWEPSGPDPPEEYQDEYGTDPGAGHEWYQDRLQQAFETTDKEQQKQIAFELQEYIVDNVVQTDLLYSDRIEAWRNYVKGYKMGTFSYEYRSIDIQK